MQKRLYETLSRTPEINLEQRDDRARCSGWVAEVRGSSFTVPESTDAYPYIRTLIGFWGRIFALTIFGTRQLSPATHAYILKPHGTQAHGIEQILGVHNDRVFEEVLDAVEIERAKLRPACAHNQRVHAFRRRIR